MPTPSSPLEIAHDIIDILVSPNIYTNKYLKHFAIYEKDQNGQKARREFDYPLLDLVRFAADTFPNNCLIGSDTCLVCEKLLTFNEGFWKVSDITDIKEIVEQYIQPKCPSYQRNYLIGFCNN